MQEHVLYYMACSVDTGTSVDVPKSEFLIGNAFTVRRNIDDQNLSGCGASTLDNPGLNLNKLGSISLLPLVTDL